MAGNRRVQYRDAVYGGRNCRHKEFGHLFTGDYTGQDSVALFPLPILFAALVLVTSVAALAEPSPAGQRKADFSKVRKSIEERLSSIPSIAIAVARNGEILWEEGFGWADRENHIPATEHTMYYTASVTKSFTATALMILCERKKVDLDRAVNDYLTGAKLTSPAWNPAEATVRRVVTHTAGLTTFNSPPSLTHEEMI